MRTFCFIVLLLVAGCEAACPNCPPEVEPGRRPRRPHPWMPWRRPTPPVEPDNYQAQVAGPTGPDGTEVALDYPGDRHIHNSAGTDRAGLCVFASMHHAGDWQNNSAFSGLFEYMKRYPGAGWPKKVDDMLRQYCREKGLAVPDYVQIEANDYEALKLACKTGRMPCVTYSRSPTGRYNGRTIAHMVNLVHADSKWFVVLDNNYPGSERYEWIKAEEFPATFAGRGTGWMIILLTGAPSPPPHNKGR